MLGAGECERFGVRWALERWTWHMRWAFAMLSYAYSTGVHARSLFLLRLRASDTIADTQKLCNAGSKIHMSGRIGSIKVEWQPINLRGRCGRDLKGITSAVNFHMGPGVVAYQYN